MTTAGNLQFAIGVDGSELTKGLNRASAELKTFNTTANKAMTGLSSAVAGLKIGLMAIVSGGVVAGAGQLSKAFQASEVSVRKLESALKSTGRFSEAFSKQLTDNASRLQQLTTAEDDALTSATAKLALLAKGLDVEALQQAQQAIVGLADVFFNGDLEKAGLVLGKTVGSATNALARYGITIDKNATQEQKLQQVMQQTQTMFAQSQALANTTSGRVIILRNNWGDLQETLGQVINESFLTKDAFDSLNVVLTNGTQSVGKNAESIVWWGRALGGFVKMLGDIAQLSLRSIAIHLQEIVDVALSGTKALVDAGNSISPWKIPTGGLNAEIKANKGRMNANTIGFGNDVKQIGAYFSGLSKPVKFSGSGGAGGGNAFDEAGGGAGSKKGGGSKGPKSAIQKTNEDLEEAKRIFQDTKTPLEKYRDEVAKLDRLLGKGYLANGTYNRALKEAKKTLEESDQAMQSMRQSAKSIFEETRTPLEKYNVELKQLNELLGKGLINQDTFNRKLKDMKDNLDTPIKNALDAMALTVENWSNRITDSIFNGFGEGGLKGMFQGLLVELGKLIFKLLVVEPILKRVTDAIRGAGDTGGGGGKKGGGIGGLILQGASLFTKVKGFAGGGMPPVGVPSLVGENGPELIVPSGASRVFSNSDTKAMLGGGGGGDTYVTNYYIDAIDTQSFDQRLRQHGGTIGSIGVSAVNQRSRRRAEAGI